MFRFGQWYRPTPLLPLPSRGKAPSAPWTYDAQNRLESVTMPESGTTSYVYNPDGTLLRKTDAKGQKVEYAYVDTLKRLTSIQRFAAGQSQPDPCQAVSLYYDVMYVPAGVSPNQNPYGHTTMSAIGGAGCVGGEIVERYDFTKAGAVSYKEMTVTKDYGGTTGIASNTLNWSRMFDGHGRVVTEYYDPEGLFKCGDYVLDGTGATLGSFLDTRWRREVGLCCQAPRNALRVKRPNQIST